MKAKEYLEKNGFDDELIYKKGLPLTRRVSDLLTDFSNIQAKEIKHCTS